MGSCYPPGTKLDAWASSTFTEAGKFVIGYFSPGIVCPSGWSTAGVVARSFDSSVSTSGIYQAPPGLTATTSGRDPGFGRPFFNPIDNAIETPLQSFLTFLSNAFATRDVSSVYPDIVTSKYTIQVVPASSLKHSGLPPNFSLTYEQ